MNEDFCSASVGSARGSVAWRRTPPPRCHLQVTQELSQDGRVFTPCCMELWIHRGGLGAASGLVGGWEQVPHSTRAMPALTYKANWWEA